MEDKFLQAAPPPPYSSGVSAPMVIGQQQIHNPPYPIYHGQPQPNYGDPPPPLNGYNAAPTSQNPMSSPLIQQPTITAVNSTPHYYQPRPFGGIGFRNPKHTYIAIGLIVVVFLLFVTIFLVVFFTIFNKANQVFDDARQMQNEISRKHNW